MLLNNLRLNNDKTELLVLHAKHGPKPPLDSITVGDATVEPTFKARNIGTAFDDFMSFEEQHVNELCMQDCFRTGARIHLSEKNSLGLGALLIGNQMVYLLNSRKCHLRFACPKYNNFPPLETREII